MDSRLDAIFRTGFRPMEKTDTWQGISREEQTDAHKRREHEQKEKQDDATSDDTVLSTRALHNFLLMLLLKAGETSPAPAVSAPATARPAAPGPGAQRASQAAGAYQNTARASSPAVSLTDLPPQEPSGPPISLSAEELRRIHMLLKDVETLAERGIATITLRPAEDFLQSLSDAVKDAL